MARSLTKPPASPYRHDALRDTHWIGKGVGSPWWVFIAIVLIAGAITYFVGAG